MPIPIVFFSSFPTWGSCSHFVRIKHTKGGPIGRIIICCNSPSCFSPYSNSPPYLCFPFIGRWYACLSLPRIITFVATLALGSRPRQKGLQGCGPKGSLGATLDTPGSEGECEGVSHHTPKATPTLGDGVPVDFQNFRERFEGSNLNGLWRSLYHWKALEA
jgi:hypothetical protein